jgi:pseudouridine kinase
MAAGGRASGRVCCVGAAVLDRKLHLIGPPVPGTSNPARASVADGGVARNVAETLARLGVPVSLVSRVGDDEAGRAIVARLAAVGVDTGAVTVVAGGQTGQYVAVLGPDHDLLLGAAAMDVLDGVGAADVDRGWPADASGSSWVFLDCNCPAPALAHGLARGRADGVPVAVDAVSAPKVPRLPADLAGVAVLFCNRAEARAWVARHGRRPDGDAAALAARLRAAGAGGVVLTLGSAGLLVADANGPHEVPAVPATPADVTGAGDALVAGTLSALLAGQPLPAAAATGTLVAALTVESEHTVRPDLNPELVRRAATRDRAV